MVLADLCGGPERNFQIFTPLGFLAEVTQHIPNKGEHLDRCYGWYSYRQPVSGQEHSRPARQNWKPWGSTVPITDPSRTATSIATLSNCRPGFAVCQKSGARSRAFFALGLETITRRS